MSNDAESQDSAPAAPLVFGGQGPFYERWKAWKNRPRDPLNRRLRARQGNCTRVASNPDTQADFLENLETCGNVYEAADEALVPVGSLYYERKKNPEFSALWDEAVERFTAWVEAEIIDRAMVGREDPIFQQGRHVGSVYKGSDPLLVALARKQSEVWRAALASGSGTTVNVNASAVAGAQAQLGDELAGKLQRLSPAKRAALRTLLDAQDATEALPPPDAAGTAERPATGKPVASPREPAMLDVPSHETGPAKPGSGR